MMMKHGLNKLKLRVKENFIKNKVLLIVFTLVWLLISTTTLIHYGPTLGKESLGNESSDFVIEVDKSTKIEEILNVEDDLESISIRFATYARKNKGLLKVTVLGNDDNFVYANEEIKVSSLNDNAYKTIKLKKNLLEKDNKTIKISITSDCETGLGVGMYYSANKYFGNSQFKINNKLYDGDATIRFLKSSDTFNTMYLWSIVFTITGITALIMLLLLIDPKYHILFPSLIFVVGMIFVFIISPLSPPDEQFHYECTLQMSNVVLNPKQNHVLIDETYTDYYYFYGHYNTSASYQRLVERLHEPLQLTGNNYEIVEDINIRYWGCYIPHAIAVTLARLCNANFYGVFLSGRIAGLIVYCLCVYWALKTTPTGKLMIGTICSMPMFIQTAASYSYDTYLICLAIIVLAYFLKWSVNEEKITIKEYLFVLICCAGLAPLKFIYGFIALIFLFVPSSRFIKKWVKWPAVFALIIAGLFIIVPIIFNRVGKYFDNFLEGLKSDKQVSEVVTDEVPQQIDEAYEVSEEQEHNEVVEVNIDDTSELEIEDDETGLFVGDLSQQEEFKDFENIYSTKYAFSHPIETAQIFLRTIRYNIKNWFYGSLGRGLAGSTLIMPTTLVHLMCIIAVAVSIKGDLYAPNILMKIVLIGVCVVVGLLMMAGFFVTWTDASQIVIDDFGGIMVQGIQGRYFCPLLPYFFMIFNNKKIKFFKQYDKCTTFVLMMVLFEVIVYVLSYTFVV